MTWGNKGIKFERKLKKILKGRYNFLVIRAAGSMGCADLVAVPPVDRSPEPTYLIEVKSTRKEKYYTSSNKDQYKLMKEIGATHECISIYAVRWIDSSPKSQWEIFLPSEEDIFRKGEGIELDKYFSD